MIVNLKESQIDGLIKLVLAEERTKKGLLNEGASSIVMSDLKNKIQARMKGSLKIGPKLKNYPTAIDIIGYSNGRSLTFFDNGVVKWYDGKNFTKGGKWDYNMTKEGKLAGGWLKNDKGVNVSLDDAINYAGKNYGTGAGPLVTKTTNTQSNNFCDKCKNDPNYYVKNLVRCRNCATNDLIANSKVGYDDTRVWSDLYTKLNQYKPSTVKLVKSDKGDAYFLTNYMGSIQLGFYNYGDIKLYDGTRWTSIGKWDLKMQKDGKLSGGWLSRNNGEKVSLGPALNEPNLMPISWMLASKWNNKPTTTPVTKGKNYPYGQLKTNPSPELIAMVLKDSHGTFDDYEAYAEAAFEEIRNIDTYNRVKKELGKDPWDFVASFMNPNMSFRTTNSQSIRTSMTIINQNTGNNKGLNSIEFIKECKLVFTLNNPGGINPNNNKPNSNTADIDFNKYWSNDVNGKNKDPLIKWGVTGYYSTVPNDFGWKFSNNIYPYPVPYNTKCLNPIIMKEYYDPNNKATISDRTKVINPNIKPINTKYDPVAQNRQRAENTRKEMVGFNNSLFQQKNIIPKYCNGVLSRVAYKSGIWNQGKVDEVAYISTYNLCRNFGGLWVYENGGKYTCDCRDKDNPALLLKRSTSDKFADVDIKKEVNKNSSINWSAKETSLMVVSITQFASAFIPVIGPYVSAGISLGMTTYYWKKGDYKTAAVEFLFSVLPLIGKIPSVGKVSEKFSKSIGDSIIKGIGLNKKQIETLQSILAWDTTISSSITKQIEKNMTNKVAAHIIKTSIKKVESKVIGLTGLPTYGDLKKKAAGETLAVTTGVEDKNV